MFFKILLSLLFLIPVFYQRSNLDIHNVLRKVAHHKIEAKYGPEFSFTNKEILNAMKNSSDKRNPTNSKWLEKWMKNINDLCVQNKCKVEERRDNFSKAYKVTFVDGWWFQVGIDVGCLEVQAKASTYKMFKSKKNIMERFVFKGAKDLGLTPHERIGGGHLNLDLATAFNNDSVLFRNFIVDRANHPELVWGIFGGHLGNAPPIAALEPHLQSEFYSVIQDFDDQKLNSGTNDTERIQDLADQIQNKVYLSNPLWLVEEKSKWDPDYYQDMNFRSLRKDVPSWLQRLELRGMRPQQNLNEFFLEMEYMDARLNYLNRLNEPLKLKIPDDYEMPVAEKKEKFLNLIEETGLSQKKFSIFLKGPIATGRVVIPKGASCRDLL